jgi:hypothetical protein
MYFHSSLALWVVSSSVLIADSPPFPTGTHRQLVRTATTRADGLPSDEVQGIAAGSDGAAWAVAAGKVVRWNGERWTDVRAPSGVTAVMASRSGSHVFIGAPDGVLEWSGGEWRGASGPKSVIAFAESADETPWALASSGVWRFDQTWKLVHELHPTRMHEPRSLLPTGDDDTYVLAESGLFELMGKRKYWMDLEVRGEGLASRKLRALARLGADHVLVATDQGLQITNGLRGWRMITAAEGLPILEINSLAVSNRGTVWAGSDSGLIRWDGGRFTYLAGKRWLPDDRVTALATAPDESVWVGTVGGVSHIESRPVTLAEKAAIYQQTAEQRDRRHGFVTIMQLQRPGDVSGARQEISDNDGLWTSMYVAAQAFRAAATHDAAAQRQASRSLEALLRLERITGIPGFPARAIVHESEPEFAARALGSNPEWHPSPVEKGWYWKGDTSSDELDGHYFGWYVFAELAGTDSEKRAVRETCKRVTDHILDHGYYLVDIDGKATTWGVWAPERLNDDPKWYRGRGLNSLEILSHLKVASHLVGDPRYEEAYRDLIHRHHYAINAIDAKTTVSHDDQLAFLSYYPLLQLERDSQLRALYTTSLRRTWQTEHIEANPLWNFIYGASTGEPCDVDAAVESLREMPLDLITWRVQNSRRVDLQYGSRTEQRGPRQLVRPLPFTERAIHKWDANPFVVDGGNDQGEGDPTIWLLPYWMGRYHRIID